MAVGHTVSSTDVTTAISAVFDGATWTLNPAPSATPGTTPNTLLGVDCSSRTSCTAVGAADGNTLAERWDGTTWKPATGASTVVGSLSGVSCPRPTMCLAVGRTYDLVNPATLPFAVAWDASAWTATPPPVAVGASSALNGVSCTSPNRCVAERWTGSRWVAEEP